MSRSRIGGEEERTTWKSNKRRRKRDDENTTEHDYQRTLSNGTSCACECTPQAPSAPPCVTMCATHVAEQTTHVSAENGIRATAKKQDRRSRRHTLVQRELNETRQHPPMGFQDGVV